VGSEMCIRDRPLVPPFLRQLLLQGNAASAAAVTAKEHDPPAAAAEEQPLVPPFLLQLLKRGAAKSTDAATTESRLSPAPRADANPLVPSFLRQLLQQGAAASVAHVPPSPAEVEQPLVPSFLQQLLKQGAASSTAPISANTGERTVPQSGSGDVTWRAVHPRSEPDKLEGTGLPKLRIACNGELELGNRASPGRTPFLLWSASTQDTDRAEFPWQVSHKRKGRAPTHQRRPQQALLVARHVKVLALNNV
jgi:hypothetical protein